MLVNEQVTHPGYSRAQPAAQSCLHASSSAAVARTAVARPFDRAQQEAMRRLTAALLCWLADVALSQHLVNYWDLRSGHLQWPAHRSLDQIPRLAPLLGQPKYSLLPHQEHAAQQQFRSSSAAAPATDYITAVRKNFNPPKVRTRHTPRAWLKGTSRRSLLQTGFAMPMLDVRGQNFAASNIPALGNGIGSSGSYQTGFGSGYDKYFGDRTAQSVAPDSTTQDGNDQRASNRITTGSVASSAPPASNPYIDWPTGSSGSLVNPVLYQSQDTPYVAQAQTQAGQRLVAQAAAEQQQLRAMQLRTGNAPPLSAGMARIANAANAYRKATQGLGALGPIVTSQMARSAPNGGDDDPSQPSDMLAYRTAKQAPSVGGKKSSPPASGVTTRTSASGETAAAAKQAQADVGGSGPQRPKGAAQGYLDEYDYGITPLKYSQGSHAADRDKRNLDLSTYVSSGPFKDFVDPASPDLASMGTLAKDLSTRIQSDLKASSKASSQQGGAGGNYLSNGLSPETNNDLNRLLQLGYGQDAAATLSANDKLPPGVGDIVGSPAGRGFGYGDYYEEDYADQSYPTGVPSYMQQSAPGAQPKDAGPQFRTGPAGDLAGSGEPGSGGPGSGGLGGPGGPGGPEGPEGPGGPGRLRNTSVGEIAPFCQPPILICADRDLINFLATEIDQVRFPDNVLEYNSFRFRLERVFDNLFDTNFSPWAGPTFNFNEVLALNYRLRETIGIFNGLNGLSTNRLTLNTLAWDASRLDRILPETLSYNTGAFATDTSFNRVDYVPTYIITGTGPGFATTAITFGPFTEFQVADFRS